MKRIKQVKPVEPVLDYDGKTVWRCGDCGCKIFHPSGTGLDEVSMNYYLYCAHCGKEIKWTTRHYIHERNKVFAIEHGLM